jgi:aminoglycoside phosphotransferase
VWCSRKIDRILDGDSEFLLMTEVAGATCCELVGTMPSHEITACLAEGLREIHGTAIDDCPFDQRIEMKLEGARANLEHSLVDEDDFDEPWQGCGGQDVYQFLVDHRPEEDHLVFGHGDYCLPNVLVEGNEASGFVDLGGAGICDVYNDLAIASRSIVYNLGQGFDELFFELYGVPVVNRELVGYYRAMDELF